MRVPDAFDRQDAEEEKPNDEDFACRYCKASVYWGDHYKVDGFASRRLFNADNKRLHACGSKLDPDAFVAVPE